MSGGCLPEGVVAVQAAVKRPPVSFWWSLTSARALPSSPRPQQAFRSAELRLTGVWDAQGSEWSQSLLAAAVSDCALLLGHYSQHQLATAIPCDMRHCWCTDTRVLLAGLHQVPEHRCLHCMQGLPSPHPHLVPNGIFRLASFPLQQKLCCCSARSPASAPGHLHGRASSGRHHGGITRTDLTVSYRRLMRWVLSACTSDGFCAEPHS